MKPGINAVVGDFGSGKTLFLTYLASAYQGKRKVFANFTLFGLDYVPMAIEDVAKFPDEVRDGIILWDEGHIGLSAYSFFKKDTQNAVVFLSQVRKRNLIVFWSTQIFKKGVVGLRDHSRYMFTCEALEPPGCSRIRVFDSYQEDQFVNEFVFDGRQFFDKYDTNEIILPKADQPKEKQKKSKKVSKCP